MEVEDEEEEDLDFNPFLREETPSDASSSLTSENEDPSSCVHNVKTSSSDRQDGNASSRQIDHALCPGPGTAKENENSLMQNRIASGGGVGNEANLENHQRTSEAKPSVQQCEELTYSGSCNKHLPFYNGSNAGNSFEEELGQTSGSLKDMNTQRTAIEISDEDAICRRTRARHSLANYTLEELETFLQESDDDCDLQNVDEEEEYRKFLAAVLLEGAGDDTLIGQGDENLDEDENDADFEIEIEEALESDADENTESYKAVDDKEEDAHRPETRQKKRQKESAEKKKYCLGQPKLPLRPILPYVSHAQVTPVPACGWQYYSPKSFSSCSSSLSGAELVNGFTAQQIGHLYCLIHEHVQLLVQVFSVCVLDPSRQQVAVEIQKMITEMVTRREEALTWRKVSYPEFCFGIPHLYSTINSSYNQSHESSRWMPFIDNPVLSILDVEPLRLTKSYMTDVTASVLRYRQSHLEISADKSHLKREPLFPLPIVDCHMETDAILVGGSNASCTASPLSPSQLQPKKSLAATLVESTKKQSVALVPVDIARLAQRFFPLFNAALFPHKPPVPAVANRVLFTDAEDGLLAMGLMKYNNDWGSIQKHFLPCKSKHQIFIRQKNRSSSKAPENPIKAVRRMKTSPLTTDEKARIYEGLKLFKHDWLSVWKFFVPHRDPLLLPRQWRIATGTQKSYSKSEAGKEKRRLYEAKRRKMKASIGDTLATHGEEVDNGRANSADEMESKEDEAYVHEAFLADSEHRSSIYFPYDMSLSSITRNNMQPVLMMRPDGICSSEKSSASTNECGDLQQENGGTLNVTSCSKHIENTNVLSNCTRVRYCTSYAVSHNNSSSNAKSSPAGSRLVSLPSQAHKRKGARVVKLAPDLPPVNLPPSVRVISQSAFQGLHPSPSYSNISNNVPKDNASVLPRATTEDIHRVSPGKQLKLFSDNGAEVILQQDGDVPKSRAKENSTESEFQMHPLLFQLHEDQFSSYYSTGLTNISSGYNFLTRSKVQVDRRSDDINTASQTKEAPGDMHTIDFHPLLRRTENASGGATSLSSNIMLAGEFRRESDCHQFLNKFDYTLRESLVDDGQLATDGAPTCHKEKENGLDLDIRLYYAIGNGNGKLGCRGTSEHQYVESASCLEQRVLEKGRHSDKPSLCCKDKPFDFPISSCSSVQSCRVEDVNLVEKLESRNGCPHQCTEESHEESIPGIVMEHEELSDSDEDSVHVEFEHEEMDDSEDDELEGVQPSDTQNEGIPTFVALREHQVSCQDESQAYASRSLQHVSVKEGDLYENSPKAGQHLCRAKLARLAKQESTRRETSCKTYLTAARSRPHQSSRARGKSSKVQSLGVRQLPLPTDTECKSAASRKPRKRPTSN
ncbi:uncharacterized protein [Typha angustifolia]|uniref:uncharacterized protein n=1 Tax=Typha angustifolia TaxID=59011 RepID=UPI003C302F72